MCLCLKTLNGQGFGLAWAPPPLLPASCRLPSSPACWPTEGKHPGQVSIPCPAHSPSQRWAWSKGRLAGKLAEYCLAGSHMQLGDSGSKHCLARVGEGDSLLLSYPPPGRLTIRIVWGLGFPWCSSGQDSVLPMQGAWVPSLEVELDLLCHDWRSYTLQGRLKIWCAAAKTWSSQINKFFFFFFKNCLWSEDGQIERQWARKGREHWGWIWQHVA